MSLHRISGHNKRSLAVSVGAWVPFVELTKGISFYRVKLALASIIKAERGCKPGEEVRVDNLLLFGFMLIAAPTWTRSIIEELRAVVAEVDTGADSQIITPSEYPTVEVVMKRRSIVAVRRAKE